MAIDKLLCREEASQQLKVGVGASSREPVEDAAKGNFVQGDRFAGVAAAGSRLGEPTGEEQDD